MPNLDQRRAAFAWERVENAARILGGEEGKQSKAYESYKNLAKAAPALIMNNGLMQTLAFFWSKGNEHDPKKKEKGPDHHDLLRADILAWLHGSDVAVPVPASYQDAMRFLHSEATSEQYRLATEEAMHLLRWIRQFADS
ncbi:MAG: type III-B CRISPR module-associated protein Cmr5 [Zetaproteobacteria bacterium]|nr:MAG: type III-B CRISPR module-associated protein Cmr5 [Zetaproteobacteria bacterium]